MNSPFDKAKYQALLKGLEATEISFSELGKNQSFRIDSFYFGKDALQAETKIKERSWSSINDAADDVQSFGAYALTNSFSYQEEGIPFLRCLNIKKGLVNFNDVLYISEEANQLLSKSEVQPEMVLLTMSGSVGNATVALPEWEYPINSNQDIAKITVGAEFSPYYVAAFLGCSFGQLQMDRLPVGSVQQHIFLWMIGEIVLPKLSDGFQLAVEEMMKKAYSEAASEKSLYAQAETLLLRALGLENWQAPVTNNYTVRSGSVWDAARLDAEHFHPQFQAMLDQATLHAKRCRVVSDFASFCDRGTQPIYFEDGTLAVVNSKHILESGLDYDNFERTAASYWNERDFIDARIERGDILTYTTGANIGRTAVYLSDEGALASNHVNLTRIEDENPVYVAVVLNSMIGRMQTRRACTGSAQVELYPSDIRQFIVPFVAPEIESEIVRCVEESHVAKRRAKALLERAKRAVEVAIEADEAAGFAIL